MAVFATLFGKLAQSVSSGKDARVQIRENSPGVPELLALHVGMVPNPLSERSKHLTPRIEGAKVFHSVCPYCAVGCGQLVYVKDDKVIDIEGDPASPISGGCLCPKGSASYELVVNKNRWTGLGKGPQPPGAALFHLWPFHRPVCHLLPPLAGSSR